MSCPYSPHCLPLRKTRLSLLKIQKRTCIPAGKLDWGNYVHAPRQRVYKWLLRHIVIMCLDGARLMVKNRVLSRDAALFHYFQYAQGRVVRQSPVVDEEGRLSEWPEGFFDQHRRNAASLARRRQA